MKSYRDGLGVGLGVGLGEQGVTEGVAKAIQIEQKKMAANQSDSLPITVAIEHEFSSRKLVQTNF